MLNKAYTKCFIDLLCEKESCMPCMIEEIMQSGAPVFLYGAGARAEFTFEALSHLGDIEIAEIVVDDEYVRDDATFKGMPIMAFNSIIESYEKVNVIIGITNGATKVARKLSGCSKVNKIYFIDVRPSIDYSKPSFISDYIESNQAVLTDFYNSLEDRKSKETMLAYFNQIISGKIDYISAVYESNQYFPEFIKLQESETFIDCGAYDGDTVRDFLSEAGDMRYSKIYAFEPDTSSFDKLKSLEASVTNLHCFQIGTWNKKTQLKFSNTGGHGSSVSQNGEIVISVDTIDNIVQKERVTYIKMDVEGAEYNSLQGAVNTIKAQKPKLAICVYHKIDDLVLIPALLKEVISEYKFYLRAHFTPYADELVLYAIAT